FVGFSFSSSASAVVLIPFFFPDPAPTEIYTLSLHDALPIWNRPQRRPPPRRAPPGAAGRVDARRRRDVHAGRAVTGDGELGDGADRKSTRLNSSHVKISYAVFCLKKKKQEINTLRCTSMTQR